MGHYIFGEDLEEAKKTEEQIATILANRGWNVFQSSGPSWDLRLERFEMSFTIEIKEDFLAAKTGNIAIEFESRGKPSGINVTKADFWWIRAHRPHGTPLDIIIPTIVIKLLIAREKEFKTLEGGDEGSNTKMYLFPIHVLKRYAI